MPIWWPRRSTRGSRRAPPACWRPWAAPLRWASGWPWGYAPTGVRDYGFRAVTILLVLGSLGFVLLATGLAAPFVVGAILAFALGWGWPGLFNLAVVHLHREAPGAATGVSQTGIYVGAAGGPAAFGALYSEAGYTTAWLAAAGVALAAALMLTLAGRTAELAT